MHIFIPTRGRTDEQRTLSRLPRELRCRTTLVCPAQEQRRLACLDDNIEVFGQPDANMRIAGTREWIVQVAVGRGYDKIIMLDDDLSFATRGSAADASLRKTRGKELVSAFKKLEDKLGPEFPHVGFGVRQGNHLEEAGWKIPGRMCHSLAYYLPIVAKEASFVFGGLEIREDFCFTLQLLLKGYPNAVWTETVVDQNGFSSAGGCSTYRTMQMSNNEAERLAHLFPEYVSVVKRDYRASIPRLEVTVQWKQALENGLRYRINNK
jgi:hypothetical protein